MSKRVIATLSALSFAFLLTLSGCGDSSCGQEDKDNCTSAHNTCVSSCNPLSGYEGCINQCETDYCDCLENAGCDCD